MRCITVLMILVIRIWKTPALRPSTALRHRYLANTHKISSYSLPELFSVDKFLIRLRGGVKVGSASSRSYQYGIASRKRERGPRKRGSSGDTRRKKRNALKSSSTTSSTSSELDVPGNFSEASTSHFSLCFCFLERIELSFHFFLIDFYSQKINKFFL